MGGGRDGHEVVARIEAGVSKGADDVRKGVAVHRAHIEHHRLPAAALELRVHRARNLVARSELVHEALAASVQQQRALASNCLRDQEAVPWPLGDESRRVELEQLEVSERGAGITREQQPAAERSARVGGSLPKRRAAAGRQHRRRRRQRLVRAQRADADAVLHPQGRGGAALVNLDARLGESGGGKHARHALARAAASGVHHPAP